MLGKEQLGALSPPANMEYGSQALSLPLPPFPRPVHEQNHPRPLLVIDWNSAMWLVPSHFLCFPFKESGLCVNPGFFSVCIQPRQLADCEEILTEFDKKCLGLKLMTAP